MDARSSASREGSTRFGLGRGAQTRRSAPAAWAGLLALAVVGCAPLAPAPGSPPVPRQTGAPRQPQSQAVADTTPSPQAREVLSTIPEPLPEGARVPPPEKPLPPDTLATPGGAEPDSGSAEVPVPVPTVPLGRQRSGADSTSGVPGGAGETSEPPAAGSPAAPGGAPAGPATPGAARPSGARPDTCWRIQIFAPTDSAKAEETRANSTSLLLVPMTVEKEAGRFKVRTRDCLPRESADLLRRRAIQSGFTQAFRVRVVNR